MFEMNSNRRGFSLAELSIVLIIIGLLVAGVSGGSKLVNQARLKAVMTEKESYVTAVRTFKLAYDALPGDMSNAADFWAGTNCVDAASSNSGTQFNGCNGNGNGMINNNVNAEPEWEGYNAWLHLADSGIISGSYVGQGNLPSTYVDPDSNVPSGPFSNSCWSFEGWTSTTLIFGGASTSVTRCIEVLLTPREIHSLDNKFDDGLNTGQMKNATSGTSCNTGDNYNTTATDARCSILFKDLKDF